MILLLLAVCGNSANLMLARASTRQRDAGVRMALGAGRARIVSLLLAESVVLALAGAALGAAIAVWGTNALRAVPMIGSFPIRFQTEVDATGLAIAIGLGLACGVIFGIAPATQLAAHGPAAGAAQRRADGIAQPLAQRADGHRGGARADRARRRGDVLPKLRRDARHRSRVPAARACCSPPTT